MADQHVRADADEFDGVVGDEPVAARQQLQGKLAFADAGLAGEQHAHAQHFHVHAVHRQARRKRAREVELEVVDDHRAWQRRGEQRQARASGFGLEIRVDLGAVGDHHRGRAFATEELAQRRRARGFGEFLQVFNLGFADHLDAVPGARN